MTTQIEMQKAQRELFIELANGEKPTMRGPKLGGMIGALKKRGLIASENGGYVLTAAGRELLAQMQQPKAPEPKAKKAKAPKAPKEPKAKKEPKPRHNERTMGYVAAVRATHGAKVSAMTDEAIGDRVWRFASVEKAVAVFAA